MSNCLGCGIKLNSEFKDELGYTTNIETGICERCFRLKNYGEYKVVSLSNKEYSSIIDSIPKDSLIVYVADILSLSLMNIFNRDNTLLVLTKYDIMPKSTKEDKIIFKLKKEYPDFLDILVVSSLKNYNIDVFYGLLNRYARGKDIYFVGNTNSGKSTLINKLIQNYGDKSKANITVSMYPSTTLDRVEINLNGLKIVDTPGLIDDGSYVNILSNKDLKMVMPKREIRPRSCQVNGKGSVLIGNLARVDYDTKELNSFVIYTAVTILSKFVSYEKNTYRDFSMYKYSIGNNQDIVLPGLGFIKFTKAMDVVVYVPDKVRPYVRNNLV